jgi:hypothetical protein
MCRVIAYNALRAAIESLFSQTNSFHREMTSDDFYVLTETMRRYGGNFCTKLADAICVADSTNKQKIIKAFPELVEAYGPGSRFAKSMFQEKN